MAGVIGNDRKQGANVRRLLLTEIERLFVADPHSLSETELNTKRELLLRMAANTLPRLHELTGEDGNPIVLSFDPIFKAVLNAPTPEASTSNPVTSPIQDNPVRPA